MSHRISINSGVDQEATIKNKDTLLKIGDKDAAKFFVTQQNEFEVTLGSFRRNL